MTNIIEQGDLSKNFSFEICHVELDEFESSESGEESMNRNRLADDVVFSEAYRNSALFYDSEPDVSHIEGNNGSSLQRSSSLHRMQKAIRTGFTRAYEHVVLLRAFLVMLFFNFATIVSASPIFPSSTTARGVVNGGDVTRSPIGKGLGFVWRSFGDLGKVLSTTPSLTSLKSLHNSIEKGSEALLHTLQGMCPGMSVWDEDCDASRVTPSKSYVKADKGVPDGNSPIELQVMVKPSFIKQRVEKINIKKTPSSYQSVYDFHTGLAAYDDDSEQVSEEQGDKQCRDMKREKKRDYMLELVDTHFKNSAEIDDFEMIESSIHALWDSFEDLSKSCHNNDVNDVLKYETYETRLFPATMAAKKIFEDSPLTVSSAPLPSPPSSGSRVNLKQSPEAVKGLLAVLERAHWWCNNPFAKYSNENAAQVHVLTTTPKYMVVGFRGSSTIRDIVADLSIGSREGPLGVNVHKGFLGALNSVNEGDMLIKEIDGAISKYGVKRIIFAGYSLGGAVASLFLLKHGRALQERGIDFRCVTFGCPRFIQQRDVEKLPIEFTSKIMHTFSEGDPIPLSLTSYLPWATRYAHVGNTVVLRADGTSMTVEKEEGKERHHTIKWANPLAFHNHLQENYQKLINFAQIQLKINHLILNPITKSISNMLKQEKLSKEWREYMGVRHSGKNKPTDESDNFFRKVLNENEEFPELKYAY